MTAFFTNNTNAPQEPQEELINRTFSRLTSDATLQQFTENSNMFEH